MGHVTDATSIQFRMLNRSKGPAMWSPRAQCDRAKFIWAWREVLENTPNLHIWQDQVRRLIVGKQSPTGSTLSNPLLSGGDSNTNAKVAVGVETYLGMTFKAKSIVLTAGTFLNGLMHIGRVQLPGGRCAEPPSLELSESIAQHGVRIARMKTGTPVRIDARSVDFSLMTEQPGDTEGRHFSFLPTPHSSPPPLHHPLSVHHPTLLSIHHPPSPPPLHSVHPSNLLRLGVRRIRRIPLHSPSFPAGLPIPTMPFTNAYAKAFLTLHSTTAKYKA